MQISELSERSGLPVQTIKFYIREGLLPKGVPTGATRAEYTGAHLERLRLIRALREVGGLPVGAIRRVLAAVEDPGVGLHDLFGTVQYALGPHGDPPDDPGWRAARADVDALVTALGWRVTDRAPARDLLAQAVAALRALGFAAGPDELAPYVRAASQVARDEIGRVADEDSRAGNVHRMLVSTVLYERVLIALHRLAQEDASARRFGTGP